MFREMLNLDKSGRQLQVANQFDALPIALITASSFFRRSVWTAAMPIPAANRLREKMHREILKLSTDCIQIQAEQSGHFVWIDQSEAIVKAIEVILGKVRSESKSSIDS